MMGAQVGADWAWIGVESGAGIGYRILATSSDDIDFGPFIGRYVPGAPSSTVPQDAPDAPPWITFGPVATGSGKTLMTVSVRDSSRGHDHVGRLAWSQRLFVISFADLAKADASYQAISDAVFGAIPAEGSRALSLPITPQPLDDLIETIESYGFENLAALAAAVLEGPVVVAGAAHLRREQRLALFDAVAALLPYGFRADLSASSFVNNTSHHGIRLAFAEFPNDGQQLLSLRTPIPELRTEAGRHYLDMLSEKQSTSGLGVLIKHLQDADRPYSFQDPGVAVAILIDLDFDGAFRRQASKGPVPIGMLRKFFRDQEAAARSWASFEIPIRDNALSSYLPRREAEAAAVVIPCWSFVGNDVIRLINDGLDRSDTELASWCLRTVGDMEDRVLGRLLVPEQIVPDRKIHQQRRAMLIELLGRRDPPQPNDFRYTCDQLRYGDMGAWQARLFRGLLIRELAGEESAERGKAWVQWLCQSDFAGDWARPGWVAALDFTVFSPPDEQGVASVRSLILGDPYWAAVLLRLARLSECLGDMLAYADREVLVQAAQVPAPVKPSGAGARLRAELDRSMWPLGVPPAAVASIDVARILLGGMPVDFTDLLSAEVLDGYFAGLESALALPATQPRLAEIEGGFLRCAVPTEVSAELTAGGVMLLNAWAKDPRLTPGLLDHIARVEPSAYPYHRGLSAAFWNTLGQHPDLAGYAAGKHLVTATTEALQNPQAAIRRVRTENAVTSTALALACLNARRVGLSIRGMVRALYSAEASRIGARMLDVVLREFQDLRYREYLEVPPDVPGRTPKTAAEAELFECYWLIANGALGGPFAEEFKSYLRGQLKSEIQIRAWLLDSVLPTDGKPAAIGSFSHDEPTSGTEPSPGRKKRHSWRHWRPRLRISWRKDDHVSRPRRGDRPSEEVT